LKNGATKEHEEVCTALTKKGVIMLDAPVSGGVSGAEHGTLAVIVVGDQKTFETCKPILQHIGANVFHVGDMGSGCVAKLVNNMLAFINTVAASKGITLGTKAGVDPHTSFTILCRLAVAASWAMEKCPNKVSHDDFTPGFTIDLAYKDLHLALAMDDQLSVPLLMGSLCINLMRQ
jgi:3-hydroxyisobutyrate dehydrogenase-like beta-hydroxyacid dehydrogenase